MISRWKPLAPPPRRTWEPEPPEVREQKLKQALEYSKKVQERMLREGILHPIQKRVPKEIEDAEAKEGNQAGDEKHCAA